MIAENTIKTSMYFRFLSLIVFIMIYNKQLLKTPYLTIPLLTLANDLVDSAFIHMSTSWQPITDVKYIYYDKMFDALSYVAMLPYIYNKDMIAVLLILWRTLGVIIYTQTKNVWSLVFGVDYVKEYLLLKYFNVSNEVLLGGFIAKLGFEYGKYIYFKM